MAHSRAHRKRKCEKPRQDVECNIETNFEQMLLPLPLLYGLRNESFIACSPIQQRAIPLARSGLDLLIQSKSGTGKTLVFGIVMLESFQPQLAGPQSLVLAPTREIAVQIQETIRKIGRFVKGFRIESFIGGMEIADDRVKIQKSQALVGTPGRILHLITNGVLKTTDIRLFVLDEADQLISASFQNDIRAIRKHLPVCIQTLAVSATFENNIDVELAKMMYHPVGVTPMREVPILLGVKQYALVMPFPPSGHILSKTKEMFAKVRAMDAIYSTVAFNQSLVFSNSQSRSESYCNYMLHNGWPTEVIHGQLSQPNRLGIFLRFKANLIRNLLATDLMARGIDSEHVNLVINIDVPEDSVTYLHRIGRAGRFGSQGIAITLVSSVEELNRLRFILGSLGGNKMCVTKFPMDLGERDIWEYTTMDVREMIFGMDRPELVSNMAKFGRSTRGRKATNTGSESGRRSKPEPPEQLGEVFDEETANWNDTVENNIDNVPAAPSHGETKEENDQKRDAFEHILKALSGLNNPTESALSYSPQIQSNVKNAHPLLERNVELLSSSANGIMEEHSKVKALHGMTDDLFRGYLQPEENKENVGEIPLNGQVTEHEAKLHDVDSCNEYSSMQLASFTEPKTLQLPDNLFEAFLNKGATEGENASFNEASDGEPDIMSESPTEVPVEETSKTVCVGLSECNVVNGLEEIGISAEQQTSETDSGSSDLKEISNQVQVLHLDESLTVGEFKLISPNSIHSSNEDVDDPIIEDSDQFDPNETAHVDDMQQSSPKFDMDNESASLTSPNDTDSKPDPDIADKLQSLKEMPQTHVEPDKSNDLESDTTYTKDPNSPVDSDHIPKEVITLESINPKDTQPLDPDFLSSPNGTTNLTDQTLLDMKLKPTEDHVSTLTPLSPEVFISINPNPEVVEIPKENPLKRKLSEPEIISATDEDDLIERLLNQVIGNLTASSSQPSKDVLPNNLFGLTPVHDKEEETVVVDSATEIAAPLKPFTPATGNSKLVKSTDLSLHQSAMYSMLRRNPEITDSDDEVETSDEELNSQLESNTDEEEDVANTMTTSLFNQVIENVTEMKSNSVVSDEAELPTENSNSPVNGTQQPIQEAEVTNNSNDAGERRSPVADNQDELDSTDPLDESDDNESAVDELNLREEDLRTAQRQREWDRMFRRHMRHIQSYAAYVNEFNRI